MTRVWTSRSSSQGLAPGTNAVLQDRLLRGGGMRPSSTTQKYGFRIRTRQGFMIERLTIHGRDEADAERKLRQIYQHCEILERRVMQPAVMRPGFRRAPDKAEETFEAILSVVSR
jgi:hypothetical protein